MPSVAADSVSTRHGFDPTIPPKRKRERLTRDPDLARKGGTSNGSTRLFAVQHTRGRDRGNHRFEQSGACTNGGAGREPADRPNVPYEGSKLNRKLQIVNLLDLEAEAQKILPSGGFGYISGGSGANWTRRENTEAFSRVQIEPMALSGVSKVDLTTEILGSKLSLPVFIPPMGSHGRAHVEKEAATSRGAAAAGTLMTTSTVSNLSLEEIASQQSRPEMVPVLRADRPRLYPRADPARQSRRLYRDRADRRQCLVLSARGEHPQRVRDAGVARPGQHAARCGLRHGIENAQCPQARPRLEGPGVDQGRSPAWP